MNEGKKKIIEKMRELFKKLIKDKKALVIVVIGVVGMLLILLSGLGGDEAQKNPMETQNEEMTVTVSQLTTQLEALLEKINGAGRVKAMITLESCDEKVYAKDSSESLENSDSKSHKSQSDNEYVIIESGSQETGLVEKIIYPKIRGVAVVCDGADNPLICQQIVQTVSALFDLRSTNISVASMAD